MLHRLARTAPKGDRVEIGAYLGSTSVVLAHAAKASRNPLVCVDTWQNEGMTEGLQDTFWRFHKNTRGHFGTIRTLRGDSAAQGRNYQGSVGFLFVDGDHSLEAVAADIRAWFPHLVHGAVVAFHDIGWAEGVQGAFEELARPQLRSIGRLPNLIWGSIPLSR